MDIQHLRFAVAVERSKSISKAAEKLYVSQPFLSKAIRELELDVGIEIFNRTSRGVTPTKKGEEFLAGARNIIASVEELENSFDMQKNESFNFEVSVPIACYISHAFVGFIKELDGIGVLNVHYRETNTMSAIEHVLNHDCNIGIIRYKTSYEDYYLSYLKSKGLKKKQIWRYEYQVVVSKDSDLLKKDNITAADLEDLVEISHGDPTVPRISQAEKQTMRSASLGAKKIVVFERQSQFELLCTIPRTYMLASPTPKEVMDTYPIAQRKCSLPDNEYADVLIYRSGYHLSKEERLFLDKIDEHIQILTMK